MPGAEDAPSFWRLLTSATCAIGRVPEERWQGKSFLSPSPNAAGCAYTNAAGVLGDVFGFDAGFFGVSPREAAQMDPQQRLLMMAAWEAVESAGAAASVYTGDRTGVFVGASGLDYGNIHFGDPASGDSQFMTGNTLSIIANRIAHFLDARGPSYVVDTACSSSLFAFEAAFRAIREGRIDRAIVGGANLLLSPMPFIGFSRAGMLSPRGRCTPFDADADGYVRAEGVVAFVLSAVDDCAADGGLLTVDGGRVRSIARGAGVNSDGRARALSVPNGAEQMALMRRTYAEAGLSLDDLAFFEAHGTGTSVGDPIEAAAIGEAVAQGRRAPLPIGSVKSNIGHLEPASGLAGLLKAQLALEHRLLPPTLGVAAPNPVIDFDALNLSLTLSPLALPATGPLAAGVNSFGFGGANAHVVIQTPEAEAPIETAVPPAPLVVSAATAEALRGVAARWREALATAADDDAAAMARHAAHRGALLPRRLAVAARDRAGQVAALDGFIAGQAPHGWVEQASTLTDAPVAFVFAGNGAQWPGMGVDAYAADSAFRESLDAMAALVAAEGGPDIIAAMHAPDLAEKLTQAPVAQPLLMALQLAIVDALAARGVRPAAVVGHSVGEVAAACAAGVLTRTQAARLTVRRARRQAPLYGCGAMAAALTSMAETAALIADSAIPGLDIAADNSPRGVTVTGEPEAITAFVATARKRKIAVRRLNVDYPFHGPLMERIREGLQADLAGMTGADAAVPFVSTTYGRVAGGAEIDGDYWWRNARRPVLFREAMLALADLGPRVFVEIGPQPALQNYITDTLAPTGLTTATVSTLRRQGADAASLDMVAMRIAAAGASVERAALFGAAPKAPAAVPAYPWTLAQHRIEPTTDGLNVLRRAGAHPVLGWRASADDLTWRTWLDLGKHPWLRDHAVDGAATAPGALFLDLALAAAREAHGDAPMELSDVDISAALTLHDAGSVQIRTCLDSATGGFRVESRASMADGPWTLHAAGTVRKAATTAPGSAVAAPAGTGDKAFTALYERLSDIGLQYGPAFQRATAPTLGPDVATAPLTPSTIATMGAWALDPTTLDAAFHLVAAALSQDHDAAAPAIAYLPVRVGRLTLWRAGASVTHVRARITRRGARGIAAEILLVCADGAVAGRIDDMRFAAVRMKRQRQIDAMLWRQTLRPIRLDPAEPAATPDAWRDPAARMTALGLLSPEAPDLRDDALIADAMARRLLWDAAIALAPAGGVTLRARASLPAPTARVLMDGLQGLSSDGAYDPVTDRVSAEPPSPTIETLGAALLQVAPHRPDILMTALHLRHALTHAPSSARPDETAATASRPDAERLAWRALELAATDLLGAWPANRPLSVLVAGAAPPALVALLSETAMVTATTLKDVPAERHLYDVVLAAGLAADCDAALRSACADRLVAGGLAVTATALDDPLQAMALAIRTGSPAAADDSGDLPALGYAASSPGDIALHGMCKAAEARRSQPSAAPRFVVLAPQAAPVGLLLAEALRRAGAGVGRVEALKAVGDADHVVVPVDDLLTPDDDAMAAATRVIMALRDLLETSDVRRATLCACLGRHRHADAVTTIMARVRRVLANEYAGRVSLRHVSAQDPGALAQALMRSDAGDEMEIALRDGAALAPRIGQASDVAQRAARRASGSDVALTLTADALGGLETLRWRPRPRRRPAAQEIEIAVTAAGLNFRDVMWAMGALPEEAVEDGFAGAMLGMECAGVVTRAGQGSRFREGDAVIAFAAGAMSTHVVVSDLAAASAPEGVTLQAAATLPVVFGTAWRGLVDLGQFSRGETVLIHGGAGGVGLAALQLAQSRGGRVLATAGTQEKRDLLRLLGAEAVFDSRTLAFEDAVMAHTGDGVDVALNSLSGEAMVRSLACVAPFGRFVELGKRDYYANTMVGLRPMRRNVSYFGVDLDAMLKVRPAMGGQLLSEVSRGVTDGAFSALPYAAHDADDAISAFRLMQRAGHVGKVLLTPPDTPAAVDAGPPLARADGAYLIAGGARGLGLRFAERLAARGARRIWLTSRSGHEDAAALGRMRRAGARVEVVACDVSDEAAMRSLLDRIDADGAPLRGVALTAMVLDDAVAANLTQARLEAVLRPKLQGGAILDRLTRGRGLDFFLLFSSVSTLFGNPGQTAYVAANAGLEAIAAARRRVGEPALAMGFGPIGDVGVLAQDATARRRLERRGAGVIDSATALDALEAAHHGAGSQDVALTAAPMRWGALLGDAPVIAEPLFAGIDRRDDGMAETTDGDVAALIAGLDDATAVKRLTELFRAEAAIILRQPVEEIDPSRPLADLGFDSLMGMELKLTAEEKHGLALPALSLSDGATLTGIAARLVADMRSGSRDRQPDRNSALSSLAARHMSDSSTLDEAVLQTPASAPRAERRGS